LIKDLKGRGLFDSTLVLWGGEFGRTPSMQSLAGDSRAHFTRGYTMWLAGGGVQRGISYGSTDELGTQVAENKVHVYDLFATILWLMGLDHEKLTYRYAGRDQRLTDVYGHVVRDIFA
jgi:arylsulfatase A-like enzyme